MNNSQFFNSNSSLNSFAEVSNKPMLQPLKNQRSLIRTKINFNEILDYALRSQLAYTINQLGWEITEKLRWRETSSLRLVIQEVPSSEVNVVLEIDDNSQTQWIAIRGSSNVKNWLLNFQYMQRSFSKNFMDHRVEIDLHTGFYIAADDVYQAILPHLNPNYQTRLTGHSLGGAIAVILMMFLKEDGYLIEKCITFGQPKVTDQKGSQMCQHLPLLRIINHEDVVPLLPPETLFTRLQGGYHHFGARIVLQHGTGYSHAEDSNLQNTSMYNFWMRLFQSIAPRRLKESPESIKDHDLRLYLLSLSNHLESRESRLDSLLTPLVSQIRELSKKSYCPETLDSLQRSNR